MSCVTTPFRTVRDGFLLLLSVIIWYMKCHSETANVHLLCTKEDNWASRQLLRHFDATAPTSSTAVFYFQLKITLWTLWCSLGQVTFLQITSFTLRGSASGNHSRFSVFKLFRQFPLIDVSLIIFYGYETDACCVGMPFRPLCFMLHASYTYWG